MTIGVCVLYQKVRTISLCSSICYCFTPCGHKVKSSNTKLFTPYFALFSTVWLLASRFVFSGRLQLGIYCMAVLPSHRQCLAAFAGVPLSIHCDLLQRSLVHMADRAFLYFTVIGESLLIRYVSVGIKRFVLCCQNTDKGNIELECSGSIKSIPKPFLGVPGIKPWCI